MAFTKKTWVNVPDPSNLPDIPEGQDALARFDAENMNRIEDGIDDATTTLISHVSDIAAHNRTEEGGGAVGTNATSTVGGAVGHSANASNGGGAVGYEANANSGGAVGYRAKATTGGAVGGNADTTGGGAVGLNTKSGNGFAGGVSAKTVDTDDKPIDAIQLGTGTNSIPKSLQVYDKTLMNADGTIPDERIPNKAPKGHGLGENAKSKSGTSFIDMMQNGCGFYQVGTDVDTPRSNSEWMSLLQVVRTKDKDNETGVQLAFYDFDRPRVEMWLRTVLKGEAGDWVEMLHTGNKDLIYTYGTTDLTAGESELETGKLYFVYE